MNNITAIIKISIHALCEEGDPVRRRNIPHRKISIHALCEEGDSFSFSNRPVFSSFLSTPSARRATCWQSSFAPSRVFLSTPSARRATAYTSPQLAAINISIHALCEEGDNRSAAPWCLLHNFYPRPLRGGRRVPCDSVCQTIEDFYPRPLRGGRHIASTALRTG